jgi:hypothetical protein
VAAQVKVPDWHTAPHTMSKRRARQLLNDCTELRVDLGQGAGRNTEELKLALGSVCGILHRRNKLPSTRFLLRGAARWRFSYLANALSTSVKRYKIRRLLTRQYGKRRCLR